MAELPLTNPTRAARPSTVVHARAHHPARLLAGGVTVALALVGCGGDETERPASTAASVTATSTRAAPAASGGPASLGWDEAPNVVALATDRRAGLRFSVRKPADDDVPADERELRVTVTVLRSAPRRIRLALARTAGYQVQCDPPGRPPAGISWTQGILVAPTGPATQAPTGRLLTTEPFFRAPRIRAPADAVASCDLTVATERRGSTERTYGAAGPLASVRFG